MTWKTLDEATARMHRAQTTEDVIRAICEKCPKANLDFTEKDFCPIQAKYGFDGEHEYIQYNDEDGFRVRCLGYESIVADEKALYEKRMRGDWS